MHINDIPTDVGAIPALTLSAQVAGCSACHRSKYGICQEHRFDRLLSRDWADLQRVERIVAERLAQWETTE